MTAFCTLPPAFGPALSPLRRIYAAKSRKNRGFISRPRLANCRSALRDTLGGLCIWEPDECGELARGHRMRSAGYQVAGTRLWVTESSSGVRRVW
jgi:hypothetical protein